MQSATQKIADALGYTVVGELIGIDPILLMYWVFAGGACLFHVCLLWFLSSSWVVFLREKGILMFLLEWLAKPFVAFFHLFYKPKHDPNAPPSTSWWVRLVDWVEEKRTTSVYWWYILFLSYSIWTMLMEGPYSLIQRIVSDPDTSCIIFMGIVAPIGIATITWTLMNPSVYYIGWISSILPSGWIQPPGSSESIVWVTGVTLCFLCGTLELLNAIYPPVVNIFMGDVSLPVFYAGIVIATAFACIMSGIEIDGNHASADSEDEERNRIESYHNSRVYHLGFLSISLMAVVLTYIVLPAVDRKSFLPDNMRPMRNFAR